MKNSGHILRLLATVVFSAVAVSAAAQNSSVSLGWGASIPTGGGNFRNETCWISPSVDWDWRFVPHLSLGVSAGYGLAVEKGVTHDLYGGDIVDGYTDRRLSTVPLLARVRWFPLGGRESLLRPFVSLSGGGQYARFDITGDAINSSVTKSFGALFSAGLGVRLHPVPAAAKGFFVELSGGWRWAGNKFEIMNTKSQRGIELRLGAGFSM
jgi:hypothetical protein